MSSLSWLLIFVYLYTIVIYCQQVYRSLKFWGLLIATALINMLIAYFMISSDYENGLIGDCLLYDNKGLPVMDEMNIVMFGFVNALFTAVLFFLLSVLVYKWKSKTVKYYPF